MTNISETEENVEEFALTNSVNNEVNEECDSDDNRINIFKRTKRQNKLEDSSKKQLQYTF